MTASAVSKNPPAHAMPQTAMILAAGYGRRMRLTAQTPPKPLTPLLGKTLLDRMIEKLQAANITRLIVNVHFAADRIEAHLAKANYPLDLHISDERSRLLDTGGAVVKARPLLGDKPFYLCNADIFWHAEKPVLPALAAAFDAKKMDACLLLANPARALGYTGTGDFLMNAQNGLTRYLPEDNPVDGAEKVERAGVAEAKAEAEARVEAEASPPARALARSSARPPIRPLIYAGVQVVHPRLLAPAPSGAFSFNLLWNHALSAGRLYGLELEGQWMHIGTPEGLADATQFLQTIEGK